MDHTNHRGRLDSVRGWTLAWCIHVEPAPGQVLNTNIFKIFFFSVMQDYQKSVVLFRGFSLVFYLQTLHLLNLTDVIMEWLACVRALSVPQDSEQSAGFSQPQWWPSSRPSLDSSHSPESTKIIYSILPLPLQDSFLFRFLDHFRSVVSAVLWFLYVVYLLYLI